MRTWTCSLLTLGAALCSLACAASSAEPGTASGASSGSGGAGSNSGGISGGGSGTTVPGITTTVGLDGGIEPGGMVDNPCETEDAPEDCELVASGPACGDGEINLDPPEACDDGNSLPGDGCSGTCVIELYHECPTPGAPCVSTIVCGDGVIGPGEACDDANTADGDGCSASCNLVETGYVCRDEGAPCTRVYICGDGITDPNEGCDDANGTNGDGCSDRCRVETGFKCEGDPSVCSATTCGDGIPEGAESCDDGNAVPFDGCSITCQAEPICSPGAGCTSSCGDGMTLNDEECDDGNLRDGDGCSSTCTQEVGFICTQPEGCTGEDCVLDLPIIYRDFSSTHSDFEVGCGSIQRDVVEPLLGANGKPVLSAIGTMETCIASAASFAEWYTDVASNSQVVDQITLYANGAGGYVNRFGPNGEQYINPDGEALDGTPLFFPLDPALAAPGELRIGQIPEEVYGGSWMNDPDEIPRNFSFSSEIAYWFEYADGMTAELSFVGDDDIWVFVNGHLAVDIGGMHVPVAGRFALNADGSIDLLNGVDGQSGGNEADATEASTATIADFGLTPGNVYEVRVFHAERRAQGSSYRLTLSGFDAGPSDCVTDCGDGEIGPGEECDDGTGNTGEYNQCTPQCTLGPRCGDAILQDQFGEICDDGVNDGAYGGCAPDCQLGPHCGDSVVQPEFEQCDDGVNDGGYGECAQGCVLGPFCGDGNISLEFEECDDGANEDGDGCSAACKLETVVPK